MTNPCKVFLTWNSRLKAFTYYDKERREEITINNPVEFYPFAMYNTIKGFSDTHQRNIWSNEVKDHRDTLKVVTGVKDANDNWKELYVGPYNKKRIEELGAYFVKSVYAVSSKGTLVNFQLRKEQIGLFLGLNKAKGTELNQWTKMFKATERTFVNPSGKNDKYWVPFFKKIETISTVTQRVIDDIKLNFYNYKLEYLRRKL